MDANTRRILVFDGGGERGYLSILIFRLMMQRGGIAPTDIWKLFDVIAGTSTGGLIALALAFGKTPDEIVPFYTTQGPYIFSLTSLTPSIRPNFATKLVLLGTDTPFYDSSGPTAPYYGVGLLRATLTDQFGTSTMQDLKTSVVIPTYQKDALKYRLCSNINNPNFVAQNELISNVALSTSAAPAYLPPLVVSSSRPGRLNGTYIDGGVYQNNPTALAYSAACIKKPYATRDCIMSIGTGLGEMGFDEGNPDIIDPRVGPVTREMAAQFDTIAFLFKLFSIACAGGQESVSKVFEIRAQSQVNNTFYYRFQPNLPTDIDTELDNTSPEILTYYEGLANSYYNTNYAAIGTFMGHLTA